MRETENFKLEVTGVKPSKGKRKICRYWVHCLDKPINIVPYKSRNFEDTDTWFKADKYQKWYWCGCACWVVVNDIDKEILLLDGYVSKATTGANSNYNYDKNERRRVAKFVNLLRHFTARNYRVLGILASHKHGDHVGDIPYILGGLKADRDHSFMDTGVALTGRAYEGKVTVVCSSETAQNAMYGDPKYDSKYCKPRGSDIYSPKFGSSMNIDMRNFAIGRVFPLGSYRIQPYIWDHGILADGRVGGVSSDGKRRTLAYRIWHQSEKNCAIVFFTSGFCEHEGFVEKINSTIPCHHIIFAWNGHRYTADAARRINLLGDSPVGSNYIFTNHTDNNSNAIYRESGVRNEVTDMFGMFLERGVIDSYDLYNDKAIWGNHQERNIKLGVFYNRLGVD